MSFNLMIDYITKAQKNARATAEGTADSNCPHPSIGSHSGCPVRYPVNDAEKMARSLNLTGVAGVLADVNSNYDSWSWSRIATRLFDAKLLAEKAQKTKTDVGDPTKGEPDKPLPPASAAQIPDAGVKTPIIVAGIVAVVAIVGIYFYLQG